MHNQIINNQINFRIIEDNQMRKRKKKVSTKVATGQQNLSVIFV